MKLARECSLPTAEGRASLQRIKRGLPPSQHSKFWNDGDEVGAAEEQGVELLSRGFDTTEVAGCVSVPAWAAAGLGEAGRTTRGTRMVPAMGLSCRAHGAAREQPLCSTQKEGGGPKASGDNPAACETTRRGSAKGARRAPGRFSGDGDEP